MNTTWNVLVSNRRFAWVPLPCFVETRNTCPAWLAIEKAKGMLLRDGAQAGVYGLQQGGSVTSFMFSPEAL